jgi:heme-degrading monooxygenase HmoA
MADSHSPPAANGPALPTPPYWAVIFTNQRTALDDAGYQAMAEQMETLARQRPGFLGIESTRDTTGYGITVSYWSDEASVRAWKGDLEHREAQRLGQERWYDHYQLRVARVERAYGFSRQT